jgi:hypothetical protein
MGFAIPGKVLLLGLQIPNARVEDYKSRPTEITSNSLTAAFKKSKIINVLLLLIVSYLSVHGVRRVHAFIFEHLPFHIKYFNISGIFVKVYIVLILKGELHRDK